MTPLHNQDFRETGPGIHAGVQNGVLREAHDRFFYSR